MRRGEIILLLGAALWTKYGYDTEWPRTPGATFIDPGRRWVSVAFFGWAICAAYGGGCMAGVGSAEMRAPSPTAIRRALSAVR